jgi:hypothetical protein
VAKKEDIEFAREALKAVRYGVAWEGDPKRPTHKEMQDGYWVPWHVADILMESLEDKTPNAELTCPTGRGEDYE